MAASVEQISAEQMKSAVQNFLDESIPCDVEYKVILSRNKTGPPCGALEDGLYIVWGPEKKSWLRHHGVLEKVVLEISSHHERHQWMSSGLPLSYVLGNKCGNLWNLTIGGDQYRLFYVQNIMHLHARLPNMEETKEELTKKILAERGNRLSTQHVKSIFRHVLDKNSPCELAYKVVPTKKKIGPPNLAFEEGIYILCDTRRPGLPQHVLDHVMTDFPTDVCNWRLRGSDSIHQYSTAMLRRYCLPRGNTEYSSRISGALWTMYGELGHENLQYRLLHVFVSATKLATTHLRPSNVGTCAGQNRMAQDREDAANPKTPLLPSGRTQELAGCKVCGKRDDRGSLMRCSHCQEVYCHAKCAGFLDIPEGDWFCSANCIEGSETLPYVPPSCEPNNRAIMNDGVSSTGSVVRAVGSPRDRETDIRHCDSPSLEVAPSSDDDKEPPTSKRSPVSNGRNQSSEELQSDPNLLVAATVQASTNTELNLVRLTNAVTCTKPPRIKKSDPSSGSSGRESFIKENDSMDGKVMEADNDKKRPPIRKSTDAELSKALQTFNNRAEEQAVQQEAEESVVALDAVGCHNGIDTHSANQRPQISGRRLSDTDVRTIFESVHYNRHPPSHLKFQVVPVGTDGLRLSPPSYEFEDGLYILMKPQKKKAQPSEQPKVPTHLTDYVLRDIPPSSCPWSLSGLQCPPPTAIQQRYCYPKGDPEYSSRKGGALWTMYGEDGKENLEYRLLHVYYSAKRVMNKRTQEKSPRDTTPTQRVDHVVMDNESNIHDGDKRPSLSAAASFVPLAMSHMMTNESLSCCSGVYASSTGGSSGARRVVMPPSGLPVLGDIPGLAEYHKQTQPVLGCSVEHARTMSCRQREAHTEWLQQQQQIQRQMHGSLMQGPKRRVIQSQHQVQPGRMLPLIESAPATKECDQAKTQIGEHRQAEDAACVQIRGRSKKTVGASREREYLVNMPVFETHVGLAVPALRQVSQNNEETGVTEKKLPATVYRANMTANDDAKRPAEMFIGTEFSKRSRMSERSNRMEASNRRATKSAAQRDALGSGIMHPPELESYKAESRPCHALKKRNLHGEVLPPALDSQLQNEGSSSRPIDVDADDLSAAKLPEVYYTLQQCGMTFERSKTVGVVAVDSRNATFAKLHSMILGCLKLRNDWDFYLPSLGQINERHSHWRRSVLECLSEMGEESIVGDGTLRSPFRLGVVLRE